MHCRAMLTHAGLKYTKLRNMMQMVYFALFVSFRSVGGPWVMYLYTQTEEVMRSFVLFAIFLVVQSYCSFPTMIKVF
jgi:hypothetical protein